MVIKRGEETEPILDWAGKGQQNLAQEMGRENSHGIKSRDYVVAEVE